MKKVVITGGTYSGKTTLISHFSNEGYRVVNEAASEILSQLNGLLGLESQRKWRARNTLAFQDLIWSRIQLLESKVIGAKEDEIVFFDRGIYDGFAYLEGEEVDHLFSKYYGAHSGYHYAFVLQTLRGFDERKDSGRISTEISSIQAGKRLENVYRSRGVETYRVPIMSVSERASWILARLT